VTLAHVAGFPLEETLLQFAPAGAAIVTAAAIIGQTKLRRLRQRLRQRPRSGLTRRAGGAA